MPGPAESGPRPRSARAAKLTARLSVLIVAAVASAVACAVGAWLGAWWVPFIVGAVAGVFRFVRLRGTVLPAVVGAIVGWLIPVWVLALRGQPVGATARALGGLAGLPPYAGVTLAVLALLAALQVMVGAWLTRAIGAVGAIRTGAARPSPAVPGDRQT